MKTILTTARYFFSVILLGACLMIWGCAPDGEPAPPGIIEKMAGKTWLISTVTVDGVDRTGYYTSLKLTLPLTAASPVAYTATSTGDAKPLWPASGTFTEKTETQVTRDDGVVIDVEFPSDTQMTLTFDWTTTDYSPGRAEGIKGRHVFKFTKQ
jgi:hypothetical protein